MQQLLETSAPRDADLARQTATYLFSTAQLARLASVAGFVALGVGLVIAVLVHAANHRHDFKPLSDGEILAWCGAVLVLLVAGIAIWRARQIRRLARLARDGILAPLASLDPGSARAVAGVLANVPLPALGRGVADAIAQRPWFADCDGRRYVVRTFDRKQVAAHATATSQLLVHADLPIAAFVDHGRMFACRVTTR